MHIGTGRYNNGIFTTSVYRYQGHARGRIGCLQYVAGVQSLFFKMLKTGTAKLVLPQFAHKNCALAKAGSGYSLVSPLATRVYKKAGSCNRFTRPGKNLCINDQICVGTAYYQYFFHFHKSKRFNTLKRHKTYGSAFARKPASQQKATCRVFKGEKVSGFHSKNTLFTRSFTWLIIS